MAKFSQSFTSRQRSPKIAAAWERDSQRKSASWLVVAAKKGFTVQTKECNCKQVHSDATIFFGALDEQISI